MAQGEYIKVVLPYQHRNYTEGGEGIFVYLVQGNEDKGVDFVSNDIISTTLANWGDIVTFISSSWNMKSFVVDVLPHKIEGMNFDNLTSDDINTAKKFYQKNISTLEKEKKKMEIHTCAMCGEPTSMWLTSDKEWNRIVPPELRKELLCKKCFNKLKSKKAI